MTAAGTGQFNAPERRGYNGYVQIMTKRYLQMVASWTLCFCAFLTQPGVSAGVQVENTDRLKKLPLTISLQRLKTGNVVLEVANTTNNEQQLTSNLSPMLDSLFYGFPTSGELQLRTALGLQISIHGQRPDGWLAPFLYDSFLDLEKLNNTRKMSTIRFKSNYAQRYQIQCENVLMLAIKCRDDDNNESVKEFRLRLPLDVSMSSGEKVSVAITSEWFPIPRALVPSKNKSPAIQIPLRSLNLENFPL